MSNKPLNEYKHKGLKIVDWGNEKFALEKSFKRKDSTEWERQKVTLFKSELIEIRKLIDQALETPQVDFDNVPRAEPIPFDDDEVAF
jgi:hypothetical protein